MFHRALQKSDGRPLHLFSRQPIPEGLPAPVPMSLAELPNPHLRWHPLRGEWVGYASHRQNRTFLPPAEYSPLAVTRPEGAPTEVPAGDYDVAVFENLFPTLSFHATGFFEALPVATAPAQGVCEVVVYTQDPQSSLGRLPLTHIELLLEVWAHRTDDLGGRDGIAYVFPFENRGVEVGVTMHHPHGQIYAYPFIPPVVQQKTLTQQKYWQENHRGLLSDLIAAESAAKTRMLYEGTHAVAFVPAFARYPYEVWVAPRQMFSRLSEMPTEVRHELARALKTVLLKYDGLWDRPFPYLQFLYQAPTDGGAHPEFHLHFEFTPPYRTRDRLKYLAGTEMGAGMFANDSLPEEKAAELRAVEVAIE